MFNDMEITNLFYIVLVFILIIAYRKTRLALIPLIKVLLEPKILIPLVTLISYVAFWVKLISKYGFWDISMTYSTFAWFFGTVMSLFLNLNKIKSINFFTKMILDLLKLSFGIGIVFFIIEKNVFPFWFYISYIPAITLVVMIDVVAKSDKKFALVSKYITKFQAFIGYSLLFSALYALLQNPKNFFTLQNLYEYLNPVFLTFVVIPYFYIMALLIQYEQIYISKKIRKIDKGMIDIFWETKLILDKITKYKL